MAEWQNKVISNILKVSFQPNPTSVCLSSLEQEFIQEGIQPLFTFDQMERILYARLCTESEAAQNFPLLDYLIQSWKRCSDAISKNLELNGEQVTQRLAWLNSLKALIVNYVGLVLNPEMMDMFPQNPDIAALGPRYLGTKLLVSASERDQVVPPEFLQELITKFSNDGLDGIVTGILTEVMLLVRVKSLINDYQIPLQVLSQIIIIRL